MLYKREFMCYNKTYALKEPTVGQIVVSRKGHDTKRAYLIVAVLSADFVLCVNGKHRTIDKPKCKRVKHLSYVATCDEAVTALQNGALTDAGVRKIIQNSKFKIQN